MTPRIFFCFLALAAFSLPLQATELTKIDRRIAREPAYESKEPKYCLLVFGAEARTRVWLVLDGDVLYIDRNGNGDLTEAGKKVALQGRGKKQNRRNQLRTFNAGEIVEADGKTRYPQLTVMLFGDSCSLLLQSAGKRMQMAGASGNGTLVFAAKPADAPIIQFNGPLSLGPFSTPKVTRNGKTIDVAVLIGTPGHGKGTFASSGYQDLPKEARPTIEIAFPGAQPGAPPLVVKDTLTHRC